MEVTSDEVEGRWTRIPERALFRLSGPDAARYLNGQVSNDVRKAIGGEAVPACLCSLKGRVEFLVWVSEIDGDLLVDGQIEQREALGERLDRYLIADDCELSDVTGTLALLHHFVEGAGGTPSPRLGTGPRGHDLWLRGEGEPAPEGFDPDREISGPDFAALQLRSLVPRSPEEIDGGAFPAELGVDKWAVDFHKGCYLGQEVVSRIESVGRVKRRLLLALGREPFGRESLLRIEGGRTALATRPSIKVLEKKFAAPAWFEKLERDAQVPSFQWVE